MPDDSAQEREAEARKSEAELQKREAEQAMRVVRVLLEATIASERANDSMASVTTNGGMPT